ncbi:hypothetical protein LDP20_20665, partial [Pseudomonas aeruginosa]|uniref:hypothetical protein n=1 Tax=Pseudomonas aeruginosa TaxID=287 RepID=UPI001EEF0295
FSKIFFSTQPLAPTFKPSSDQREAHSTAFKFAVKHLDEASFRAPFGTEPLRRTTCRSASPPPRERIRKYLIFKHLLFVVAGSGAHYREIETGVNTYLKLFNPKVRKPRGRPIPPL